jgi:transglutaminase/protease-like cytokinesis protein 3
MRRLYFIMAFVSLLSGISSARDFTAIDARSKSIPQHLHTALEIAHYLTRDLTSDLEKTRAIYFWIANNIKYDYESVYVPRHYVNTNDLVVEVLSRRKGLCQHYSELFHACCDAVGVKSYVICGYTRDSLGHLSTLSHAWNAVEIDGKYSMLDITWSAGYAQNGKYHNRFRDLYFMISPEVFVSSHIPFDPIWQFSAHPLTHVEIQKGDLSKLKSGTDFNFHDSIQAYDHRTKLDNIKLEILRIKSAGITNSMIANRVKQDEQFVAVHHVNSLREEFNQTATAFKRGADKYNAFAELLNKRKGNISLMVNDANLLDDADSELQTAEQAATLLRAENPKMQQDIRTLQSNISLLRQSIRQLQVKMQK